MFSNSKIKFIRGCSAKSIAGQREFYLREQMKAIQTELGEGDPFTREINELREKIAAKDFPRRARLKPRRNWNG